MRFTFFRLKFTMFVISSLALFLLFMPACFTQTSDASKSDTNSQAVKILDEINDKLANAQAISGTLEVSGKGLPKTIYQFALMKPFYYRIVSKSVEYRYDGKSEWLYIPDQKQYEKQTKQYDFMNLPTAPLSLLFDFNLFFTSGTVRSSVKNIRMGIFEEKPAVLASYEIGGSYTQKIEFIYDPITKLPKARQVKENGRETLYQFTQLNINPEPALRPEAFAWTPPTDTTAGESLVYDPYLLTPGTNAPDFTVSTPEGKSISLKELLKKNKAVLLNFWFVGCMGCQKEFPLLQKLADELRSQEFTILTLNYGDSKEQINKFMKVNQLTLAVGLNSKEKADVFGQYRVWQCPTNYLIDSSGKIVSIISDKSLTGFIASLKRMGFKFSAEFEAMNAGDKE